MKIRYGGEIGGNSRTEMWGKADPKALRDNTLIMEEHLREIGNDIPSSGPRLCWWGRGNRAILGVVLKYAKEELENEEDFHIRHSYIVCF